MNSVKHQSNIFYVHEINLKEKHVFLIHYDYEYNKAIFF